MKLDVGKGEPIFIKQLNDTHISWKMYGLEGQLILCETTITLVMRARGIDLGVKLHPLSALGTVQEATTENVHPTEHQTENAIGGKWCSLSQTEIERHWYTKMEI
jgi:hypothetical protein